MVDRGSLVRPRCVVRNARPDFARWSRASFRSSKSKRAGSTLNCDDGYVVVSILHDQLGFIVLSILPKLDDPFACTVQHMDTSCQLAIRGYGEATAYSLIPLVRHAAPLMESSGGGSVLTMTFQASQRVFPGYNIMGTAKAALENEVRQLAAEYGDRNIRVNAISAGPLDTLAARGIQGFLDMKRVHEQRAPLKRNITHEEVAKAALFLCSDLSSGVTGSIIPVDAGYHIMAV